MTCIVGYLDRENDCIWIGCDSLGSNGVTKKVYKNSKVFKNKSFKNTIIGGTSTFRHLDLLEFSDDIFKEVDCYKDIKVDRKYMVNEFIPNIVKLFKENIPSEEEKDRGGKFIIGIQDKLFTIQEDYSVLEPSQPFCAVGSGSECAEASLFTTSRMIMKPQEKITIALKAAESVGCFVQRPFKIMNNKTDEVITIE